MNKIKEMQIKLDIQTMLQRYKKSPRKGAFLFFLIRRYNKTMGKKITVKTRTGDHTIRPHAKIKVRPSPMTQ